MNYLLLFLGLLCGVLLCASLSGGSRRRRRSAVGRWWTRNSKDSLIDKHEQGHIDVARYLGASAKRVAKDRVHAHGLKGVEQEIAFLMGGHAKTGTRSGCDGDYESIAKALKEAPRDERDGIMRRAWALAKRATR